MLLAWQTKKLRPAPSFGKKRVLWDVNFLTPVDFNGSDYLFITVILMSGESFEFEATSGVIIIASIIMTLQIFFAKVYTLVLEVACMMCAYHAWNPGRGNKPWFGFFGDLLSWIIKRSWYDGVINSRRILQDVLIPRFGQKDAIQNRPIWHHSRNTSVVRFESLRRSPTPVDTKLFDFFVGWIREKLRDVTMSHVDQSERCIRTLHLLCVFWCLFVSLGPLKFNVSCEKWKRIFLCYLHDLSSDLPPSFFAKISCEEFWPLPGSHANSTFCENVLARTDFLLFRTMYSFDVTRVLSVDYPAGFHCGHLIVFFFATPLCRFRWQAWPKFGRVDLKFSNVTR